MLSLHDLPSMLAALDWPLDPTLHRLLADRIHDAIACGLGNMTHIIVAQAGDGEDDFIREAAFSPLWNPLSETRYGDPGHISPWDWSYRLDDWGWELGRTVGNDGFAFIVLVPDSEEIDPILRSMCGSHIPGLTPED